MVVKLANKSAIRSLIAVSSQSRDWIMYNVFDIYKTMLNSRKGKDNILYFPQHNCFESPCTLHNVILHPMLHTRKSIFVWSTGVAIDWRKIHYVHVSLHWVLEIIFLCVHEMQLVPTFWLIHSQFWIILLHDKCIYTESQHNRTALLSERWVMGMLILKNFWSPMWVNSVSKAQRLCNCI